MQNEDASLVQKVANQFLSWLGPEAVAFLQEQAEIAATRDDELSARAWRDLAEAAIAISEHQAVA